MAKRKLPNFGSDQEEAEWYAAHPEYSSQKFQEAKKAGRLKRLSELDWKQVKQDAREVRSQASPTITIRLVPTDIGLAKRLAERKGLRYQTYIKMLLHEALEREAAQAH